MFLGSRFSTGNDSIPKHPPSALTYVKCSQGMDLREGQLINLNSLRMGNPSSKSSGSTTNDSHPSIVMP